MEWQLWTIFGMGVGVFAAFGYEGFRASEMLFPMLALVCFAAAGYACGRLMLLVTTIINWLLT